MRQKVVAQWPKFLILAGMVVMGISIFAAAKEEKKGEPLMRQKLDHAQKILEGITLKNFDTIKEQADALDKISRVDTWLKINTPAYLQMSDEFRASVAKMKRMAQDENIHGAALAFMQVEMTCVDCHQLIREGGLLTGIK
ncbi:hypothetical protein HY256_01390 [Candidatus Sumerlaeota bacterium]|nr:hypothetical protein [Candidatus Sumerlaeota bacterium]